MFLLTTGLERPEEVEKYTNRRSIDEYGSGVVKNHHLVHSSLNGNAGSWTNSDDVDYQKCGDGGCHNDRHWHRTKSAVKSGAERRVSEAKKKEGAEQKMQCTICDQCACGARSVPDCIINDEHYHLNSDFSLDRCQVCHTDADYRKRIRVLQRDQAINDQTERARQRSVKARNDVSAMFGEDAMEIDDNEISCRSWSIPTNVSVAPPPQAPTVPLITRITNSTPRTVGIVTPPSESLSSMEKPVSRREVMKQNKEVEISVMKRSVVPASSIVSTLVPRVNHDPRLAIRDEPRELPAPPVIDRDILGAGSEVVVSTPDIVIERPKPTVRVISLKTSQQKIYTVYKVASGWLGFLSNPSAKTGHTIVNFLGGSIVPDKDVPIREYINHISCDIDIYGLLQGVDYDWENYIADLYDSCEVCDVYDDVVEVMTRSLIRSSANFMEDGGVSKSLQWFHENHRAVYDSAEIALLLSSARRAVNILAYCQRVNHNLVGSQSN